MSTDMSMATIWRQTADKWNEVVAQLREGQESDTCATCPEWTVADLIGHVMRWQAQGSSAFTALAPDASWDEVQAALPAALSDPAALEGSVEAFGGMPKQQVAGFLVGDLLIHTWDLARTIGADDTLPVEAVQSTLMGLERVPDPMLRSENMFGPRVEVGPDASPQEKLLGFVGRTP